MSTRTEITSYEPSVRDLPIGHPETLCHCGRCYLEDGEVATSVSDFIQYLRTNGMDLYPSMPLPDGLHMIYGLFDFSKKDWEIRYVGRTKDPGPRYLAHIGDTGDTYKARWIRKISALGFPPVMSPLQLVDETDAAWVETSYIKAYRSRGYRLTNATDGGEAGFDGHFSVEARRKTSTAHRIEIPPLEVKEKVYSRHTPASAAKIVEANRGEANHQAKLTWESVREMRRLMNDGFTNKEVAEMFKVSTTQACRIRLNRSWREE